MILGQLYDLALWTHPWPWHWSWTFKVRVWNSLISGLGRPIDMERKRMWVIHSWPWYWLVWPWWAGRMYRIVTGVTSDVGVSSTYLVSLFYIAGLHKTILLLMRLFCSSPHKLTLYLHHEQRLRRFLLMVTLDISTSQMTQTSLLLKLHTYIKTITQEKFTTPWEISNKGSS